MKQTSLLPEPPPPPPAESDEFYTPWEIYRPLDAEFRFTVDVAATKESAKCGRYYTQADDGLSKSWAGERVWANVPYSNIPPWVRKAEFETRHCCELVVMLLPATKTEQPWWQDWVEPYREIPANRFRQPDGQVIAVPDPPRYWTVETRFISKRIRFGYPGSPDGGRGSGFFGSVLVIWRCSE